MYRDPCPLVTAVVYSLQRYRLSQPFARKWNWGQNYLDLLSDASFWNTVKVSVTYAVLTVSIELLLALASRCCCAFAREQFRVDHAADAADDCPGAGGADVEAMTNPRLRHPVHLAGVAGFANMTWASDPVTAMFTVVLVDVWVYTPFIMILLLPVCAACPPSPSGGGAGRRAAAFRLLAHHPADADAVPADGDAVSVIESAAVRHHLRDDPGRARRQADGLSGPRLSRDFFQSTNVGRSAALLMILWAIVYALSNAFIRNWLLPARTPARQRIRRTAHEQPIPLSVSCGIAITLVCLFFMFPIVWIFLMSFQTNASILRVPPSIVQPDA